MTLASVIVVGAGGNIGSHLVPHLGRMTGVGGVTLIDLQRYEAKNLQSQDITPGDVGQPKAEVQARRLRLINPALDVRAFVDDVANVPLGLLRSDAILACLDSRAARRTVNFTAWRVGVPLIDGGVNGDELLARMNVYLPAADQPCLECAWDDADYAGIEQTYPCTGEEAPRPTNAPSALGALAASLQVLECQKLLAGQHELLATGRQVTISAQAHRHFVTRFVRNPACRFDHGTLHIERLDRGAGELTVGDAFDLGRESIGTHEPLRLHVPHQIFTQGLVCAACGDRRAVSLHLLRRIGVADQRCSGCGERMRVSGADVIERLPEADLPPSVRDASLGSVGIRNGDVISLTGDAREAHFQLGGIA